MIFLQLSGITKVYNENRLLDSIDLTIQAGDRIGLVGANGVGKTTLLKVALGEIPSDDGVVSVSNRVKIGYVSQDDELSSGYSLVLAMIESYQDLLALKSEMEVLEREISSDSKRILDRYGELQEQWERSGGYSFEDEIKKTLLGLGFQEHDFNRALSSFSGGEQNRAAIARLLLHSPELLLLDEPTNHLDIESTVWLEGYLQAYEGALMVVSHDRMFLDRVVNKIVELDHGKLSLYHGNYSAFCAEREERRHLQLKNYLEQKAEIERIEDFIRRNIVGQKHRQAQSRRKTLGKLERLEAPGSEKKKMSMQLELSRRSYQSILQVESLSFSYGDNPLLQDITFVIERGEKVALIGRNGSGKSTLVKLTVGELAPDSGTIAIGNRVDCEYFDQELSELDPESTVLDTVWDIRPEWDAFQLRSHLARFLFLGEDVFKMVSMLSGGEKKKLALARLLALSSNFLILDEPTNHLDIGSREVLEESLQEYEGTLLFISHDRYFLDAVATRILALEDGHLLDVRGNYSEYLSRRKQAEPLPVAENKEKKRVDYREERRRKNLEVTRKRRIKELEMQIADTERRLRLIESDLVDESHAADWQKLHSLETDREQQWRLLDQLTEEYYSLVQENEALDR